MSTTFEPREVEKPFRIRWLRMTLQLMLRAPIRFSIAIFLLGCLDAFVLRLLPSTIPGPWAPRLCGVAAMAIGLGLVTLSIAIQWLLFPGVDWQDEKMRSGRILTLTGAQAWMVTAVAGICFFPLLVLKPGLSFLEVLRL